ncbi:unnamed protein product [Heterobilharzia americana]|nr:unnamed protein product [Heterobilharzia americana]
MRHPRRHPHHGEKYSNIDINPKSTMNSTDCNQLDPSPPQVRKRGRPFKKKSNKLVHFSQSSPNSLSDTLSVSITKISHESETFYANKMYKSPILSTSDDSISQYTRELRPRTTITTPPPPPPPPTTTTTSNCHPPVKDTYDEEINFDVFHMIFQIIHYMTVYLQ